MARRTLLDFFDDLATLDGTFVVHDDGYRTWSYTYAETAAAARAFAARLRGAQIGADHKVVLWSENRPEWLIVLWGCLLEGVVVVPIDYRASSDLMLRIADIVDANAIVVGDVVPPFPSTRPVWRAGIVAGGSGSSSGAGESRSPGIVPDSTAEIIFTSGATADPKGVVLTHRNILANVVPIEREIAKYKRYARPFAPLRFLNLLPLSHMFGQSMATFIPPILAGEVFFMRSFAPQDIVRQIHDRRISVLVCVPKMLEVLRDYVLRVAPEAATAPPAGTHWTKKWWIYRRIHRMFGFKFWAMVVGAAPLDPDLEAFWGRLGFLVVQGYGLTETAPVVTLNHPLRASRGAVGKPISGVEVKIAEDGEILVRGENVTRGYFNAPEETQRAFSDGWFHTGDIGELDPGGHLHIRGRKKEMIVTPEGLNVFPEDVERVLNAVPGVMDSAVVGAPIGESTAERVQAVLILAPETNVDEVIRTANAQLLDHQKIRAAAVWPAADLPRTEGTRKLKRRELRQWLTSSASGAPARTDTSRSVEAVAGRFAPGRTVTPATTIDELGLSSLERVELMLALEEAFQVTMDEARFAAAKTVEDLHALVQPIEAGAAGSVSHATAAAGSAAPEVIDFPAWNRSAPARAARRVSLPTWILPATWPWMSLTVRGLEHLQALSGPVVFAANHQSHLDTPAIYRALPPRWRYRVAPAMAKEFFKAHFFPEQYSRTSVLLNRLNYYLASLFFNAFPLPQRETGTRQTLRYVGDLLAGGYSVLIFPEGKRTDHGEINEFKPGVGMIASRLNVPVVPVRLDGLHEILHLSWKFPKRGHGTVTFGAPMSLTGNDYKALSRRIEDAIRNMATP